MDARPKSPWMSKQEAAAYLGVSDWSVDRYSRDGRLPRYQLAGGQARFLRTDVEALITPVEPEDDTP